MSQSARPPDDTRAAIRKEVRRLYLGLARDLLLVFALIALTVFVLFWAGH